MSSQRLQISINRYKYLCKDLNLEPTCPKTCHLGCKMTPRHPQKGAKTSSDTPTCSQDEEYNPVFKNWVVLYTTKTNEKLQKCGLHTDKQLSWNSAARPQPPWQSTRNVVHMHLWLWSIWGILVSLGDQLKTSCFNFLSLTEHHELSHHGGINKATSSAMASVVTRSHRSILRSSGAFPWRFRSPLATSEEIPRGCCRSDNLVWACSKGTHDVSPHYHKSHWGRTFRTRGNAHVQCNSCSLAVAWRYAI